MLGVLCKASIDRMARITNGYLFYEGIDQKVDSSADEQREHGVNGLASREEIQSDQAACNHDRDAQTSIEIFLGIQGVMATRHTVSDKVPLFERAVHSQRYSLAATRASCSIPDT